MIALDRLRRFFERVLEIWVVFLVSTLTVIVVLAVVRRKAGASFVWYDEVGTIMLAWITYYGAALAALKRAHIGFDGILLAMPYRWRIAVAILGEIVVFAFFIVLAWSGMMVLEVLQGMRLISLPDVPVRFTQSVISIGATLFVICEALSLPEYWCRLREGISAEVGEVYRSRCTPRKAVRRDPLRDADRPGRPGLRQRADRGCPRSDRRRRHRDDPGHLHAPQRRAHDVRGRLELLLLAIPMFILAGAIMNSSSISRRLMDFATALVGFIRGGLAHVNIIQSMFFAEISGSAVADVAATGPIIMPAMIRRGYSRAFTAAITSSSASLAIIIPPSIPMILYGVMSGSSIVKLFVAGIIPGLLGGFAMMAISYYLALKHDWPVEERFSLERVWVTFKETGWALIMPVIILGAIFGGIVTATEGAGVAVVAALAIAGLIYRDLDYPHFMRAAIDGAVQTAVVMLLIATSALLGIYLTEAQVPQKVRPQAFSS